MLLLQERSFNYDMSLPESLNKGKEKEKEKTPTHNKPPRDRAKNKQRNSSAVGTS